MCSASQEIRVTWFAQPSINPLECCICWAGLLGRAVFPPWNEGPNFGSYNFTCWDPIAPTLDGWPSPTSCTFAVLLALGRLLGWEREGFQNCTLAGRDLKKPSGYPGKRREEGSLLLFLCEISGCPAEWGLSKDLSHQIPWSTECLIPP